jgi:hypothetical protein
MGKDVIPYRQPPSDHLHPMVYMTAIGLVLGFVVAAWLFFDRQLSFERQNDSSLLLGMVSYLLLIAIALPLIMWRVWRSHRQRASAPDQATSFRDWADGEFEVSGSRLKGRDAAIDALLPIAAVAFGLLAIGLVFVLTPAA